MSKVSKESKTGKDKQSFIDWWNESEAVKLWVGRVYSIGAAVVIVGALFKIMHFPGAGPMLCVGMGTETILFLIGCLDKPHVTYHWEKVFPQFVGGGVSEAIPSQEGSSASTTKTNISVSDKPVEVLKDEEIEKLSLGIKNLSETAEKLSTLSSVVSSVESFTTSVNGFSKNVEIATAETEKYAQTQCLLNEKTSVLANSYSGVLDGMDKVVAQTQTYLQNIEGINKNLISVNAVYELELKAIQSQTEAFANQTDKVNVVSASIDKIAEDVEKMNTSISATVTEVEKYKKGSEELSKQIAELNGIYGNMLNALS